MESPCCAVLFDADGVVQHSPTWRTRILDLVHDEAFFSDLGAAEAPTLTGQGDFRAALGQLIKDRGLTISEAELLQAWTAIEVEPTVVAAIADLRERGFPCYLATNQNNVRRDFMRGQLGYDEVFDDQFYSCELGVAKPSTSFFTRITTALQLPAESVLFLDDHQSNVDGARAAGLQAELFTTEADLLALVR